MKTKKSNSKKILKNNKEFLICMIIVIIAIIGFVVRVNEIEEENKSSYDSNWRYHQYRPRTYNTNSENSYAIQEDTNNSSNSSTINDDPYGKQYYDDADDFADDNAEEFGDGDEDDGWDDAYDYYDEEK